MIIGGGAFCFCFSFFLLFFSCIPFHQSTFSHLWHRREEEAAAADRQRRNVSVSADGRVRGFRYNLTHWRPEKSALPSVSHSKKGNIRRVLKYLYSMSGIVIDF